MTLLKYGHENAEMQERKFDDVNCRYSIQLLALVREWVTIVAILGAWFPSSLKLNSYLSTKYFFIALLHANFHFVDHRSISNHYFKSNATS